MYPDILDLNRAANELPPASLLGRARCAWNCGTDAGEKRDTLRVSPPNHQAPRSLFSCPLPTKMQRRLGTRQSSLDLDLSFAITAAVSRCIKTLSPLALYHPRSSFVFSIGVQLSVTGGSRSGSTRRMWPIYLHRRRLTCTLIFLSPVLLRISSLILALTSKSSKIFRSN